MTTIIDKPLKRHRLAAIRGGKPRVEHDGGDYSAGLIRDVSVITRGEAMGHRAWVDQLAVEQATSLGKKARNGIKARFTHPGLSSDGMGTLLGRFKNFRIDGDRAIADLHFEESAHETPDGDLAKYVMKMADEDPEAFGTSIVFDHDFGEEHRFEADHQDEDGYFVSPDDDNTSNYRHIRLSKLWATDVVDEPAANPGGLFRNGHEIAVEADELCKYALGLSCDRPTLRHLSADADRLAEFAARFLESNNLEIKEKAMSSKPENKSGEQTPAGVTSEQLTKFGDELLTKVDERITKALAAKPAAAGDDGKEKPTLDQQLAAERKRCSDLFSVSKSAGLNDHEKVAQDAIEKGLSVESFKASLVDRLVAQNSLSKDAGAGEKDPYAAFRKEYRDAADIFRRQGVSEDSYIRTRCRDEGLPVPPIEKPAK